MRKETTCGVKGEDLGNGGWLWIVSCRCLTHLPAAGQKNKSRETGIVEKKRGKKERAKRNVLKGKVKAEDYNNGAADCEIENPQKVASNE